MQEIDQLQIESQLHIILKYSNGKYNHSINKTNQKFYKDRGSDIMVVPMMQYRRNSEGEVTDKLYRATSMVVGSQEAWKKWRELRANLSEAEAAKAQKELSLIHI